jgi:integrase/recombinase XerD
MATPNINLKRIANKKGTIYQLDYRINGKRIRESVGNDRQTAELIRADRQCQLLLGGNGLGNVQHKTINVTELCTDFLRSKKLNIRPSSLKRYKNFLDPFVKYFNSYFPGPASDIRSIESRYIQEFLEHSVEQKDESGHSWSIRTTNEAIKLLRSMFRYAIENNWTEKNPFYKIRPLRGNSQRKAEYYTDDQLDQIWKKVWVDPLKFIVHTGLRKGELINLKNDKVDLTVGREQITIESCDDWDTKTGKARVIPLNKDAIDIVKRHLNNFPDYLFTSKEGKKIHPDKIYHALKKALEELNYKGDVHKFRHTFASKLVMSGVDLLTVRDLLGHSDLESTQIYTHLADQHLINAVKKLEQKNETKSTDNRVI